MNKKISYLEKSKEIELWAKKFWKTHDSSCAKIDCSKEKEIILDFFPYPSGFGLHIGHTLGYIATDIFARFKKLQGKNVLYAMGFDSFGLPAEQFAIETGEHPELVTKRNIANMKKQLDLLALNYDQSRSFSTTDTDYYKWTQWIFIQLYNSYFDEKQNKAMPIQLLEQKLSLQKMTNKEIYNELAKKRLAYVDEIEVNWCPLLGTVLANEEVINGKSERGDFPVIKRKLKQWILRITDYADRLLQNLDQLDWPESVKEMQKNWIGTSFGYEINFQCNNDSITIFTTRPETIAGVTFLAISESHSFAQKINMKLQNLNNQEELLGSFTGFYAKNPYNNELVPIYIANYVCDYATKAIIGVPAHDERDWNFAKKYNISIKAAMIPITDFLTNNNITIQNYFENPILCANYSNISYDGCEKNVIIAKLELLGAKKKKNYKLKDWVFSRQRYWGEPFPVIYDKNGEILILTESELPVELPQVDFKFLYKNITNEVSTPLDKALNWKNVSFIRLDQYTAKIVATAEKTIIINGSEYSVEKGTRETNTMPNWAGSCWYYLRYMDPKNDKNFISKESGEYWGTPKKTGSVDLYLGGAEHAVLHLLYARFWHMVLYDLGFVAAPEPFQRLFNQGMVLGTAYKNEAGKYFSPNEIIKKNGHYFSNTGKQLTVSIGKIGKRYKNGVPPEEICNLYSVDTLRLYMMYLGPLEQNKPWDCSAMKGMSRLLEKILNLQIKQEKISQEIEYNFNEMLKKYTSDCENLKFNTAISSFIIFINSVEFVDETTYKKLLIMFSIMAPHLCEYLFNEKNHNESVFFQDWPKSQELQNPQSEIAIVLAINGKKKIVQNFQKNISEKELREWAMMYCKEHGIISNNIIIIRNFEILPKMINIVTYI